MTRHTLLLALLALSGACRQLPLDPERTGVAIWPDAGSWEGPTDLIVVSRADGAIDCELVVGDDCAEPTAFLDDLATLDPGERVVLRDAECVTVDVACLPPGADAASRPLRTWSWEILPPVEEVDDEEELGAFDAVGG